MEKFRNTYNGGVYEGTVPFETLVAAEGTTEHLVLHPNTKFVAKNAFAANKTLKSVTFNQGLVEIGDRAFAKCLALSAIALPTSLKVLGESCFDMSDDGINGMYGASKGSLREVVLPDGLETVGARAFYLTGVESFVIPRSVKRIDTWALVDINEPVAGMVGCSASIFFEGNERQWNKIEKGYYDYTETNVYFFSQTRPKKDGDFWHYDQNGTPQKW